MKNISMRQMLILLFLALIAPAVDIVPHQAAMQAGSAAWLAPLLALLPILLLMWLFFRKQTTEQHTVKTGLLTKLSCPGGRFMAAFFLLWGIFLLAVHTTRCASRLATGGGTPLFFSVIVLLLVIWMACGTLPAFARACEIFYLIIVYGLLAIAIFALLRMRPSYVFLVSTQELSGILSATGSVLGVASVGVYALFLEDHITIRTQDGGRCMRRATAFFLTLSGVVILVLGRFGANLTGRVTRPFFQMVAGVGLQGAFQRLESLVSAVWVLGDLALLGFLLFACKRLFALVLGQQEKKWQVVLLGAISLVSGELLGGQEDALLFSQEILLPWGSLIVAVIILLFLFVGKKK